MRLVENLGFDAVDAGGLADTHGDSSLARRPMCRTLMSRD